MIGIYEPIESRSRTPEELACPGLLTEIAEQTGGRRYPVMNVNELPDIAAKIGVELRHQYILGYSPQNMQRDGKYRRVEVKLIQPRGLGSLRAFWRQGYYAPPEQFDAKTASSNRPPDSVPVGLTWGTTRSSAMKRKTCGRPEEGLDSQAWPARIFQPRSLYLATCTARMVPRSSLSTRVLSKSPGRPASRRSEDIALDIWSAD